MSPVDVSPKISEKTEIMLYAKWKTWSWDRPLCLMSLEDFFGFQAWTCKFWNQAWKVVKHCIQILSLRKSERSENKVTDRLFYLKRNWNAIGKPLLLSGFLNRLWQVYFSLIRWKPELFVIVKLQVWGFFKTHLTRSQKVLIYVFNKRYHSVHNISN